MEKATIQVKIVSTPGCTHCAAARKVLEELSPQYPQLTIQEIDATTPEGMELVSMYGIFASPGIIVNNQLFSTGGLDKVSFIKKLDTLLSQ